jgi:hypothetical protein
VGSASIVCWKSQQLFKLMCKEKQLSDLFITRKPKDKKVEHKYSLKKNTHNKLYLPVEAELI